MEGHGGQGMVEAAQWKRHRGRKQGCLGWSNRTVWIKITGFGQLQNLGTGVSWVEGAEWRNGRTGAGPKRTASLPACPCQSSPPGSAWRRAEGLGEGGAHLCLAGSRGVLIMSYGVMIMLRGMMISS
eukprot:352594-Chlamydomonas_euryale.AAC.16